MHAQDEVAPQEEQTIESIVTRQMAQAERFFSETLDSQPLSIVSLAFWEVLLVKGHRCVWTRRDCSDAPVQRRAPLANVTHWAMDASFVVVGPHLQAHLYPETKSHENDSVSVAIPFAVPWTSPEPGV
jgi:hypothetical protein